MPFKQANTHPSKDYEHEHEVPMQEATAMLKQVSASCFVCMALALFGGLTSSGMPG
jgi:hypothetical protein